MANILSQCAPPWVMDMKKIEAIIKPFKLEEVQDALGEIGIDGMTVVEVRGFGRQEARPQMFIGGEYTREFLPRMKLDLVVPDKLVDRAVDAIIHSSRTGKSGDGKVFISAVEGAVRIRTHETGDSAI